MRTATLVLTVTAMTGLPKPLIKAPVDLAAEVLPDGRVALPAGSLLEQNKGSVAFARGRQQATGAVEDNLVESRELEAPEPAFERSTSTLQRNDAGLTPTADFIEEQLATKEGELEDVKEQVQETAAQEVRDEEILDQETEAEVASRENVNEDNGVFSSLQTQAKELQSAQGELKADTQDTASTTTGLKDTARTEELGMTSVDGELDLGREQIGNLQDVVGTKLDKLSTGLEQLNMAGYSMTDAINRNAEFMRELVYTMQKLDEEGDRLVDAVVEIARDVDIVDKAKEKDAAEAPAAA